LGSADVYVWLLTAPEQAAPDRLARARAWLDAEELARLGRLRLEVDQRRFVLAHALARAALSREAPSTSAETWRFRLNSHGRPEVDEGGIAPAVLRFNISHTPGLVACVVARGREVGVDVEHLFPPRWSEETCLEVATSHFAPAEAAALRALAPGTRRGRFFAVWTLKESYIKARGLGLALPLAAFAFDLDAGPEPAVRFDPTLNDDPTRWHFTRLAPTPAHALAVAARRAPGEVLKVEFCEAGADFP
jgi:4'-phosphopantetheinyl transferase